MTTKKTQKDTPYLGHKIPKFYLWLFCRASSFCTDRGPNYQHFGEIGKWIKNKINIFFQIYCDLKFQWFLSLRSLNCYRKLVFKVSWDPNVNAIGNFSTSAFVIGTIFSPNLTGLLCIFFKLQNLNIYVKKTNKYCSLVMAEVEHKRLKGLKGHLSIIPEVHICISAAPS